MSFKVNWNSLETDNLSVWTKEILTKALNSGKSPNILASKIQIKDLNFGKVAPNFEILEIGELGRDRFRGIFKITYEGDFHLTLHTKVQANPLNIYYHNSLEREVTEAPFVTPKFLLSNEQFALPMDLKLSDIKISGIGIIVFSKSKGLTLVFRNDPLDSIKVSSTFDTVKVLATFLQKQIENQIRDLFRETLPTLIHQMSLNYLDLDDFNSLMGSSIPTPVYDIALQPDVLQSSSNLRKNANLFSSRETLKLNIPRFRNIIQRSHCNKFEKSTPTLLNSLFKNMRQSDERLNVVGADGSNGIPIDLLMNENYTKTDHIIREVASIQGNSFYKNNTDNHVKPKRRTIKLNSKKTTKTQSPPPLQQPQALQPTTLPPSISLQGSASPQASAVSSTTMSPSSSSETSTLIEEDSAEREELKNELSHVTTNTGLLNVGLGNSYLHFPSSVPISTSPIRDLKAESEKYGAMLGDSKLAQILTEARNERDRALEKEKDAFSGYVKKKKNRGDSKSINYIDIEKINSKLQSLRLEKEKMNKFVGVFDSPPPYYSV